MSKLLKINKINRVQVNAYPLSSLASINRVKRTLRPAAVLLASAMISMTISAPAFASDDAPVTIDDLGLQDAMDSNRFTNVSNGTGRSFRLSDQAISLRNSRPASNSGSLLTPSGLTVSSVMELESSQLRGGFPDPALGDAALAPGLVVDSRYAGLADRADPTHADSLNVRRFSTALATEQGTLTVGNDWSNFQDFLARPSLARGLSGDVAVPLGYSATGRTGVISEQVRWQPTNYLAGFSIAVENDMRSTLRDPATGEGTAYESAPNLVLSWEGQNTLGSSYRVSALGRHLELEDQEDDGFGWGLNMSGGWRFGDLFAALSVTLGNSIDSFILGRLGNADSAASAARVEGVQSLDPSLNVNPTLNYRLGQQSNLHLSLNHFRSSEGNAAHGVDTLDTVHVGYSWNPWPSTRFGIEFVGKDVSGGGDLENSNAVNFAASKRF